MKKKRILVALKSLDSVSKTDENELLTKLSVLFKIRNINWIEVDFNNWQKSKRYQRIFSDMKSAILNKHIISFSYFSSNEEETKRNAKPVRLLFKGQDWYLYAFCLLRNDFRYFKLSRIKKLEILSTNFEENFEDIILKKEFKYENIVHLKVRFNRRAAFRVYDELNTNITEDEDGNLYTEIEVPNDYNLYNYIFSFGDGAEVLEPKEIRMQIKEMINKMADTQQLTPEQYELFKNAEKRLKQKRLLYIHFFVMVLGCIFFAVANKVLGYGVDYNWYIWASLIWLFFWLWHAMNVFIFNRFLGKQWQEKQRERLIAAQQKKLIKMEAAVEKEFATQKEQAQRELAAEQTAQSSTSNTNPTV